MSNVTKYAHSNVRLFENNENRSVGKKKKRLHIYLYIYNIYSVDIYREKSKHFIIRLNQYYVTLYTPRLVS